VVEKNTEALVGELPLGDRFNLLFSGTTVSSGGGKGVVVIRLWGLSPNPIVQRGAAKN
jgi:magnesium-transporting ATPase (P-type)